MSWWNSLSEDRRGWSAGARRRLKRRPGWCTLAAQIQSGGSGFRVCAAVQDGVLRGKGWVPSAKFKKAVQDLDKVGEGLQAGRLTQYEFDIKREKALVDAMVEIAKEHGVRLATRIMQTELLNIDAKGELTVMVEEATQARLQLHGFGATFAALVSRYEPRTDDGGPVVADTLYCALRHEQVECLVRDYARTHDIEVGPIPEPEIEDESLERGSSR